MNGRVSGGKEEAKEWELGFVCIMKKDSLIKEKLSQVKLNNLSKATKLARSCDKFTPNIVCS